MPEGGAIRTFEVLEGQDGGWLSLTARQVDGPWGWGLRLSGVEEARAARDALDRFLREDVLD